MPRKQPPPGYLFPTDAMAFLQTHGIIGNETTMYRFIKRGLLHRYGPTTRKAGYYKLSELEALAEAERAFYAPAPESITGDHHLTFSQASVDDMNGVYAIALAIFGEHTTNAETRKAYVLKCPASNYVVKDNGRVVAFIHIQPLRSETLAAFLRGEIRGRHITADDLQDFAPGRPIECLIKSMGVYHPERAVRMMYMQRLFSGLARAFARMGEQGVQITKLYATSETESGIALSIHARMQPLGIIPGTPGAKQKRYVFVLDVASSSIPLLQPYKTALTEWQANHTPTRQKNALARSHSVSRAISSGHDTLPNDLVSAMAFSALHGIHESTVRKAIASERLPAIQGKWKLGRAYVLNALDAAGRARFFELYSENEHFTRCESCPHT